VATVNLDCKLDLKTIAFHARNVEYNPKVRGGHPRPTATPEKNNQLHVSPPECRRTLPRRSTHRQAMYLISPRSLSSSQRFAAAIMRIRAPKTTALIFSSGKMVCTGAKTEALAREAARKYAKVISKLGFPAQFKVRAPLQPEYLKTRRARLRVCHVIPHYCVRPRAPTDSLRLPLSTDGAGV